MEPRTTPARTTPPRKTQLAGDAPSESAEKHVTTTHYSAHAVRVLGMRRELQVHGGRDRQILAVAERQQGCISRGQLLALGVSDGAKTTLISKGWLQRHHRGVYRVGPLLDRPFIAQAAALLAVPGAVALARRSAAALFGLLAAPGTVELLATAGRGTTTKGISVRRTALLAARDLTVRDGLPVTSPAWTVRDLAGTLSGWHLTRAVDEAFIAGLVTDRELEEILNRRPHRGLRELLERERTPALTRSDGERRLLTLVVQAGLPAPRTNVALHGFTVDFYWPEHGLVVELDGRPYHSRHAAFERDRRKDQTLRTHGLQPLRITGAQLAHHPIQVIALIARNLGSPGATTPT